MFNYDRNVFQASALWSFTKTARFFFAVWLAVGGVLSATPPNIVFVITDDQGYGDLGFTGNPLAKTPNLDRLAGESSQLLDYHVAPTCSPTRAALMTGHWSDRTGVWHTINGRSMLRVNEVTVGKMLQDAGYETGCFGKWHLGDNYPYRAEDRGFTEVYRHGGGGVGQTPDVWDNAYFDGKYFHNGKVVPAEGYCTDVFFQQANRFIADCAAKKQPFFAYIATNAPHGPLHVPEKYMEMFPNQPKNIAAFYGMIANIDDNIGKTRSLLRELGIEENTLFVFTTDNGTAGGANVFNSGMRGAKGSEYEGGHRVPLLAYWPAKGWNRVHSSHVLCHAVDIAPTLLEVAGVKKPDDIRFDGRSIVPLLSPEGDLKDWPKERILVTDSQRVTDPIKWKQTAVMSGPWRLINNRELYNIESDPGQAQNVIEQFPEQASRLVAFYDEWWKEIEPTFADTTEIYVGDPNAIQVDLTAHDWIGTDDPPWNQQMIRQARGYAGNDASTGRDKRNKPAAGDDYSYWAIKVVGSGDYDIECSRWPLELSHPLSERLAAGRDIPGANRAFRAVPGKAVPVQRAELYIDGKLLKTTVVSDKDTHVRFRVRLNEGSHRLSPVFVTTDGQKVVAYYASIKPAK